MQLLVGRDGELAVLEGAVARALAGVGGVVLVAGEPGIGKTALARALSERAQAEGFTVAWGRAWEAGGAPPYWPWVEVVRALMPGIACTPNALATTSRAVLARLVPELGEGGAIGEVDAATMRFLTGEAVLALLVAAARVRPVAVVLDDLHAADRGSLEVLRFVAPRVRPLGLVLLGAYREAEARVAPDAALALAHASRDAETLRPARLMPEEVTRLVREAVADGVSQLAAEIGATSEGNPLFVLEMLRLWRAKGPSGRAMPDTVVDVLQQRLALLRPETRRLLELAAAQGRAFDVPWLALAASTSEAQVRETLGEAERADIVVARDGDHGAFTHVLIRDALYRGLRANARAQVHLACAEALERRSAIDPRVKALSLAHHYLEAAAGDASAYPKALTYVRTAAERAVELHAHEDAVALLLRAVALIDARERGPARDRERAEVLLALGVAHMRAGQPSEGTVACFEAAAIARRIVDADLLARAALAYGLYARWATVDRDMVALIQEALAGTPSTSLRARLLARLAAALQPAEDPEMPMALAREALALAEGLDNATRLEVLTGAGSALGYFADPAERKPFNRVMVELATTTGDKVRLARGLLRLVFDHLESGDIAGADRYVAAHDVLAQDLGLPWLTWMSPLFRGTRATLAGRYDEAEHAIAEALAVPGRPDDPNARFAVEAMRLAINRGRGVSDARAEADVYDRLVTFCDPWFTRALHVSLAAGHPQSKAQVARELAAIMPEVAKWRGRLSVGWLGEAAATLGDPAIAAALYPLVLELAHRNHVWGIGSMVCEGPLSEIAGRLALVVGDRAAAREQFGVALERAERMGAAVHAARIRGRLAELAGPTSVAVPASVAAAPARGPSSTTTWSLEREGETWLVAFGGRATRLKDSRGLRILATLVGQPGKDMHVFELLGQEEAHGAGDSGEVLDRAAIAAYRERIAELESERAEAEGWSDGARAEKLGRELDVLKAEVMRACGLGGRARKDGSQAERARVNVRRRLVDALERITAALPELTPHLERSLKTGVVCAYRPAPDDPVSYR